MKTLDNKYAKNFDYIMFFTVILISAFGIMNLYGSLSVNHKDFFDPYVIKQIIWFFISFFIMAVIITIDYNTLIEAAYYIYGVVFILIIAVLLKGKIMHGASRWISLGIFSFQPSELMKISLVFALAKYFTSYENKKGYSIAGLIMPFAIILLPVLLIAKEPDLGTALIVLFIGSIMIFLAGIKRSAVIILTGLGAVAGPFLWLRLKPYQKSRILIFLHPAKDYLGAGYNIIQSEIAVGSGRIFGEGFGKGSQSVLNFLPAKHTDFIFSTFMQQFGFAGGANPHRTLFYPYNQRIQNSLQNKKNTRILARRRRPRNNYVSYDNQYVYDGRDAARRRGSASILQLRGDFSGG